MSHEKEGKRRWPREALVGELSVLGELALQCLGGHRKIYGETGAESRLVQSRRVAFSLGPIEMVAEIVDLSAICLGRI